MSDRYVEERKNFLYYKYIRNILSLLSINCKSIIDIGSNQIDIISHLDCKKYSLDIKNPLNKDGITAIKSDFLNYNPKEKFDIATCFQVLEHIKDVEAFAEKLLNIANVIVISVPYKWKKNICISHIHDPVDENKLLAWFKIEPIFVDIFDSRLIAIFISNTQLYKDLYSKNKEHFFSFFKFYLEQRIDCRKNLKKVEELEAKVKYIEKEYALLQLKHIGDINKYGDPKLLLNMAKESSLICFRYSEKLFKIGMQLYPFFIDSYGHPAFIKEYFRMLVKRKLFKRALKVVSNKENPSLNIYDSKWYIVILARAYEEHKFYKRAFNLFSMLKDNSEAQLAISRLKKYIT